MSYLAVLLDQVKLSDLDIFKNKIQKMEEDKKHLLEEQGLQNIDMVAEERREEIAARLAGGEEEYIELKRSKLNPLKVATERPTGEDMFDKFIKVLKG